MDALFSDLRYSLRLLHRAPGFSAVVIVTLALGIGATTALYSVAHGVLFTPLPYPDANRLVMLWMGRPGLQVERDWLSPMQFIDVREQTSAFEDLAIALGLTATLTGRGSPTEVGYVVASSSYLRLLGAVPLRGRLFDESDDGGSAPQVAILTHDFWQRSFGGDERAIGHAITLDGVAHEVVGVLPEAFVLDNEVLPVVRAVGHLDVLLSFPFGNDMYESRAEIYNVVGKLAPGLQLERAQAELDLVAARIQELREPDPNSGFFLRAVPLHDEVVGAIRPALIALLGSVATLLLIASANVANLLLARSHAREREIQVRAALGADRGRLARQLLTETVVLAVPGGVLGIALAFGGVATVRTLGTQSLPRLGEIGIDVPVLLFAAAVTLLTGLLIGAVPAMRGSYGNLAGVTRRGRHNLGTGSLWSGVRLPNVLVVGEVGLCFVLLIVGGLLLRTFVALQQVDPGFAPENTLAFRLQLSGDRYSEPADRAAFYDRLKVQFLERPGVTGFGGVSLLPFGSGISWGEVGIEDLPPDRQGAGAVVAEFRVATSDYFRTMGIPLLRGRFFDERDTPDVPSVAIIDETFAERYFPDVDPIGKRISDWRNEWAEVVGVVGSVRHYGLEGDLRITRYYPYSQLPWPAMFVTVRTVGDPEAFAPDAAAAVHGLDPELAIVGTASLRRRISASLAPRRFSTALLQTFSGLALVLAAVGLYGVMSYRVSEDTRDLGVRMALGAPRSHVLRMVLWQGMKLAVIGLVLGASGALFVTRLLASMLFGVTDSDAVTFVVVTLMLGAITLVASLIPARRATRLDPLVAIREP